MKYSKFFSKIIALILLIIIFTEAYPQLYENDCGLIPSVPAYEEIDLAQNGGIYLTSQGDLKVLIVFVQFPDDNDPHPYWISGQPPINMDKYIDPNMSVNSSHYANVTHYFKDMSMGIFRVTGNSIYVQTPQTRQWYQQNNHFNRYYITKDVLINAVDPLVNFFDYDNWKRLANYQHDNIPDGMVDMIVMVWRGIIFSGWLGEASLGWGTNYNVEHGRKTINSGSFPNASGVTVHYWGQRDENRNFRTIIHEISHYLLGGSHPYGSSSFQHGIWSMLPVGFKDGLCANSYERERLAWIIPTPITEEILNAPFLDYLDNGDSYKYHPLNGLPNEYYYFENHQKLNTVYDDATINNDDNGIFIIHQKDIYNETNNIRCEVSDGHWNWENPYWVTRPNDGAFLPAFIKTTVNHDGRNHRDQLVDSNGLNSWLWAYITEGSNVVFGGFERGFYLNDAFTKNNTAVISPYSNPNSNTWNGNETPFAMEVIYESVNQINAHFYLNNPLDAAPAKPQFLQQVATYGQQARLTWEANTEPDLRRYRIYRKSDLYGNWEMRAYATGTSWEDPEVIIGPPMTTWYWKIKAEDWSGKQSVYSNEVNAIGMFKPVVHNPKEPNKIPEFFSLSQNYPNPFNPATNITFDLPQDYFVNLVIYNISGEKVVTLVNDQLPAGSYTAKFDGSLLPSGVYIYKIKAGSFSQIKRMLLIK